MIIDNDLCRFFAFEPSLNSPNCVSVDLINSLIRLVGSRMSKDIVVVEHSCVDSLVGCNYMACSCRDSIRCIVVLVFDTYYENKGLNWNLSNLSLHIDELFTLDS